MLSAVAALAMVGPAAAATAIPVPAAVFAPVNVPGTTAFGASPEDLGKYGYVEQEYYVTGVANRYRFPDPMANAEVVDGGHPFKTRILVRRPRDPAKFNGAVAVEWYNVTTGQDIDFNYAAAHETLLREGFAIVAVSAQNVGVNTLKTWSPARYGSLSMTAPPIPGAPPPAPNPTGQRIDDSLSWDAFSEVIKGLKEPGAVNPLQGLKVQRVIADGQSQSAGMLTRYYNSIDPLHRLVDGVVYYDGAGALRTDSSTKAITVATEVLGGQPGPSQPDNAVFRRWDVAGSSHSGLYDIIYADAIVGRDGALKGPDGKVSTVTGLITGCAWTPLWSAVPAHYLMDSAFHHMNLWIQGRSTPPSAPRFARDAGVTPSPVRVAADGIVEGGVRLAEVEYPWGVNKGRGNTGPNPFCFLGGTHRPFTAPEFAARYPDRQAFIRNVERVTAEMREKGLLLAEDAAKTVAAAKSTAAQ
jgi:hypothetical protein